MGYDPWFDSEENRALMAICTRRLIRNIGIGGILWGAVNSAIGAAAIQASLLNTGLLALGLLMLGAGVQALRRPTLGILLAETLVAALLFLWNLGISLLNLQAGGPFEPRGLVFPLVIVAVFARHYRKLGHLRDLVSSMAPEQIEAARKTCKAMIRRKLKEEPFLVETRDRRCRAQLMDDRAFFIQRDLMRAFVGSREAVRAATVKPEAKTWTAVFRHPLGKLAYRFDRGNTEKLRNWLDAGPAPAAG